jgi:hypothetical protein
MISYHHPYHRPAYAPPDSNTGRSTAADPVFFPVAANLES